jgi:hypothetical protein
MKLFYKSGNAGDECEEDPTDMGDDDMDECDDDDEEDDH